VTDNTRNKAFLLIVLAAVGIVLLAAGLPDLRLADGLPFPGADEGRALQADEITQADAAKAAAPSLWVRGVLALVLLLLMACFVFLIVIQRQPVKMRPVLITLAAVSGMIILASLLPPLQGGSDLPAAGEISTALPTTSTTSPVGGPPGWLLWLLVTGALVLVIFLGIWLFRQAFQRGQKTSPVMQEAENALAAIQAGSDLCDVIVRCYLRMNQSILEERGITREETLTPREFEICLSAKGVPIEPLRALTRLFEAVRYGRKSVDQQSEETAVACLTAIIQYCHAETSGR
jgi:hypothetical protein